MPSFVIGGSIRAAIQSAEDWGWKRRDRYRYYRGNGDEVVVANEVSDLRGRRGVRLYPAPGFWARSDAYLLNAMLASGDVVLVDGP